MLKSGGTILFNSLEMSVPRVAIKMAALLNNENSMIYERSFEDDESKFLAVLGRLDKAKRSGIRIIAKNDIWELESAIMATSPTLVVFDYLQLIPAPHGFGTRKADYISDYARGLQKMSVRRNVPILVLAQLNRSADEGAAGLGNLKDSSGIEEASDNVLFLERECNAGGIEIYKRTLSVKKARSGIDGSSIDLMLNPLKGTLIAWDTITASKVYDMMQSRNHAIQEKLL